MRRLRVAADGRHGLLSVLGLGLGLAWVWRCIRRRRLRDNSLHIFHCGEQPTIADELVKGATLQGLCPTLHTLDAFESWVGTNAASSAAPPPCILMVTTGEEMELSGSPAVSCLHFLARKSNPSDLLRRFKYAVVGLGDSNHLATSHRSISWASGRDCNQAGELFDRWCEQLGATRLVRRCESDARTDHDALGPWTAALWTTLKRS